MNITKVYLLNVPLESDYKNTLYFTSKEEQETYFKSRKVKFIEDSSYQRKDSFIRVPFHFDELSNVNYIMYQNSAYSNKWFYAFITDVKYIDDYRTDIYIETDYLQTWYFDIEVKPSFVEREHVSDDTIGNHTVPENVEMGEYVVNANGRSEIGDNAHVVIATTYDFKRETEAGSKMNGVFQGVVYYLMNDDYNDTIEYFLDVYAKAGKSDSIVAIFLAPDSLTGYDQIEEWDYMTTDGALSWGPYKKISIPTKGATRMGTMALTKNHNTLNGYTPKNKKLFTYPYNYLYLSNNAGASAIYKYEMFPSDIVFLIEGVLTPGCSIRATPLNYKGAGTNNDEGLNLGKFPICSYANDVFTNWLTQNSVNIAVGVASSALTIAGGLGMMATGAGALAGAGAVTSGALGVASSIGQVYQHSMIPPQIEGNVNCGDVIYSKGLCNFSHYKMSIKKEYAKIIDEYFTIYGYKVNRVKVPNKAHRSRFWYTKTIDVNIDGAIPNKDMAKIKEAYNKGITFWRNASEIQNYALDNSIAITAGAVTD